MPDLNGSLLLIVQFAASRRSASASAGNYEGLETDAPYTWIAVLERPVESAIFQKSWHGGAVVIGGGAERTALKQQTGFLVFGVGPCIAAIGAAPDHN